ncbi:MAG TPA: sulfurtransferase [Opitutaceae bacterium]|nr:sulfurtransferase [Opitutaceae bacterium]
MLVSTRELADHLTDSRWIVFDCRHDLVDKGKGAQLYRSGHIPGAHFAQVETDLSGAKSPQTGRHPLPKPEDFLRFLANHGVTFDTHIVAYDDAGGLYAARLWWLARWVGLRHVSLLDGGFNRWQAEERLITTEVPEKRPAGTLSLEAGHMGSVSTEDVVRQLSDTTSLVIDARAPERYRGDVEPIDRVGGHIPGAVNRFFKDNLNSDLTFRSSDELRRDFTALMKGVVPARVIHQCGSGITACVNLFAMERAGLAGSHLYSGSWSEWITDPARPVTQEPKPAS